MAGADRGLWRRRKGRMRRRLCGGHGDGTNPFVQPREQGICSRRRRQCGDGRLVAPSVSAVLNVGIVAEAGEGRGKSGRDVRCGGCIAVHVLDVNLGLRNFGGEVGGN